MVIANTETSQAWADAWRPRDRRGVAEWASENVQVPGAARSGGKFDPRYSPWLNEPIADFNDPSIRESVAVMPTGAGKTTLFDCFIPYLAAESPGDVLLLMQTDADAKEHNETRMLPTLKDCPPLAHYFASMHRHSIRKDAIIMPHMNIYCRGAGPTNVQRISVSYVAIDEAWMVEHGIIEEARARTHSRWNRRVMIVSQGGMESVTLPTQKRDTELFSAWRRTDMREFSMVCPQCATRTPWDLRHLKWEDAEFPDGTPDEQSISQSAHYTCPNCPTKFQDDATTRRDLVNSSVYIQTNPRPWVDARGGRYVGHHCHGLAIPHESWGDYAVGYKRAVAAKRAGDYEPLKTMVTKRFALFWKDDEEAPAVKLGGSGYVTADYVNGELWDGELYRCMTIDRQRDHFWAIVRAFKPDGESRLLYEGKVLTREALRSIQERYKVKSDFTFQDAQHDTGAVYDDCVEFGWVALHGSGQDGFDHQRKNGKPDAKFFSPLRNAAAPMGGRARYIFWSNEKVKDFLVQFRAGRGPGWHAPEDVSADYKKQIVSEVKKPIVNKISKQTKEIYCKLNSRTDNHLWDCECMALVFAMIKGVIGDVAIGRSEPQESEE